MSGTAYINDLFYHAERAQSDGEFGWAFYRLPGQETITFTAGPVSETYGGEPFSSSFLFSPFHASQNHLPGMAQKLEYQFDAVSSLPADILLPMYYQDNTYVSTGFTEYCGLVADIVGEITAGKLKKAVPARVKCVPLKADFSSFSLFRSLLSAYPDAFVYLLSVPGHGVWLGCSPELILEVNGDDVSTLSLAGTQKTIATSSASEQPVFSPKEFEEQEIVSDYIMATLDKYTTGIGQNGPVLRNAGNVTHLATWFSARLKPETGGDFGPLLRRLHPTPAVCGLPRKEAMALLLAREGFDRALYSGFIGPVSASTAHLYVNLRCMQVFNHTAALYAGAGVVQGSVPEKEWHETEEKMQTLEKFLG